MNSPAAVPRDFKEEVDQATGPGQTGKLTLLAIEAEGFPWQVEAQRLVVAALERVHNSPDAGIQQVIVFTGHMIDAPDRRQPRFPGDCEASAREAIHSRLQSI